MRSRVLSDVDGRHEIHFEFKDYDRLYRNYTHGDYKKEDNQYSLLLCAKACFVKKDYKECLKALEGVRPDFSTKILYERQALIMKAHYLSNPPSLDLLESDFALFKQFKGKCPGRSLTPFHQSSLEDILIAASQFPKSEKILEGVNLEELRKTMKDLQRRKKFEGLPSYIISTSWNQLYKDYVTRGKAHPGPINSFDLLNHIFEFEPHYQKNKAYTDTILFPFTEDINYVVVGSAHWKFLEESFLGFPIKRVFITDPRYRQMSGRDMLVKLLIEYDNTEYFMQWQAGTFWERSVIPLLMNIFGPGQLKEKTRNDQYLIVQPGKIQQPESKLKFIKVDPDIIKAVGQKQQQRKKKIFMCFDLEQFNPADSETKGIVGLVNLGNTCYMNSALQCLSNITDFSFYFLTNQYLKNLQISQSNKQGSQGEVSCALADIFKRIWFSSASTRYIDPTPFKRVFGIRFKDFEGNDQQDAQEFLMFLLNCLHDDLNKNSQMRIAHRDSMAGKSFEQVRNNNLTHYNKHNKSLVSELLHGFTYEEIICDECKFTTYKFEDYLMKHLEVPPDSPKMTIYYLSYNEPNCGADRITLFLNGLTTVKDIICLLKDHFELKDGQNIIVQAAFMREDACDCWKDISETMSIKSLMHMLDTKNEMYVFFHRIPVLKPDQEVFMFYYVNEHHDQLDIDGYPRMLPVPASYSDKKMNDQLIEIAAKTIMKADPNPRELIQEIKCKKVKGSPYSHAVKVKTEREIRNFKHESYRKVLGANDEGKETSLYDCLNKMKLPEVISVEEKWYCQKCKATQAAHKTDRIYSVGQVLIIQLKRFTERGKITTKIHYPVNNLNMKDYVTENKGDLIYDLKGVVLHRGSLNTGHYTSFCRNANNNKWYLFDDELVREVEEESLVDANAYILLYERSERMVR